jgi:hypothetical protein
VSRADDTLESGAAVEEAEVGGWRLNIEDDQRKLGRWAVCTIGPNYSLCRRKNMVKSKRWVRKIGERILTG